MIDINPNDNTLSRAECHALRGIAIIGIFLHNYCHWLGPAVKENEYQFFQHNVDWMEQVMYVFNEWLPVNFLSFFGHYGVPIFLFMSAYGLTMKYEQRRDTEPVGIWRFIKYHWLKLFRMMIVGFVAFTMIDAITPGSFDFKFVNIIAQLGLFNNVLPHPNSIIWPGPYWFFGLMIQLYIVYRLLIYRRHWGWTVGLMAVCIAIQLMLTPDGGAMNYYRYNFMGGMLPFGWGILYARYCRQYHFSDTSYFLQMVAAALTVYGFSLTFVGWTFAPAAVCWFAVCFIKLVSHCSWLSWLNKALTWMGVISAALFVCHPITRKIFIPISRDGNLWGGLMLYIISSICVAWLFKVLMDKIPKPKL